MSGMKKSLILPSKMYNLLEIQVSLKANNTRSLNYIKLVLQTLIKRKPKESFVLYPYEMALMEMLESRLKLDHIQLKKILFKPKNCHPFLWL